MTEKYAELTLYFGFCHSNSSGEGKYAQVDEPTRNAYIAALQQVMKYIDYGTGITVSGLNPIANSEDEAKMLIQHAETSFPNALGVIQPFDTVHGSLRFFRKIRFPEVTTLDTHRIVEGMQKSGHQPFPIERLRREDMTGDRELLAQRNREMWEQALKFYE